MKTITAVNGSGVPVFVSFQRYFFLFFYFFVCCVRYEGANGIYEGEYVDGKKCGHGSFAWIDGSRYEVCVCVCVC